MVIDRSSVERYLWGQGCDGWRLVDAANLSVIYERVPAGQGEVPHRHAQARQFFYILSGQAVMEIDGQEYQLMPAQGIEVPPETVHRFKNISETEVEFLVISAPSTRGDRIEVVQP